MTIIPLADYKASRSIQHCIKADQVVHLPVAPQPVARIRFSAITPERAQCLHMNDALDFLDKFMVEHQDKVGMVAITGPGDPLATPEITLETVKAIRSRYPQVKIGIKTHGIGSDKLAGELARAGVDYVEMEVNGVRAEILDKLYAWIRPGQKTIKIAEAVKLLLREQRNGVPALKFHNISVSILTTLYPGYNLEHVPRISADMLELGADGIALVPYSPEPAAEVTIDIPTREDIDKITEKAQKYLPIFHPLLVQSDLNAALTLLSSGKPALPKPSSERPNVAVASHNGIDINLHLGQTKQFLIYGRREDGLACLLGSREAPPAGQGDNRWLELAKILHDCFAILTASAGETPQRVLGEAGIKVMICEDNIDGIVDVLYGGGKKKKKDK
jgi:nitrogen fixation protein NifB